MPQNGKGSSKDMEVPESGLEWTLYPTSDYQKVGDMICEMDAVTQQPNLNGHECVVEHASYESAENIHVLLALRWTVTVAHCAWPGPSAWTIATSSRYGTVIRGAKYPTRSDADGKRVSGSATSPVSTPGKSVVHGGHFDHLLALAWDQSDGN